MSQTHPQDFNDILAIIEDISHGNYSDAIMEYTKPQYSQTTRDLAEAISMMMLKIEAREFQLEKAITELKETHAQTRRNVLNTVIAIAKALDSRDHSTGQHAIRVSSYAKRVAKRLELPEKDIEEIRIGGLLHDIGKIGFSDKLFENEDTIPTEEMMLEIKSHPEIAVSILKHLDFLGNVVKYVECHHERMDGTGYPHKLKPEDIPLGARIISVVDCFDAITSDRTYQPGRPVNEALDILEKLKGKSLDPKIVDVFKEEINENGAIGPNK